MSNIDLVKGVYEAFGKGDVSSVLGAFAPDIQWREAEANPYMPSGEPWTGGDAIVQNLFVKLVQEWDGFTVTPQSFYDAGDAVIVEGRYSGKNKGTGKELDAQLCHVWKVKDEKLTSFQQYVDTSHLRDVMGA